jgi:hypothetical protein
LAVRVDQNQLLGCLNKIREGENANRLDFGRRKKLVGELKPEFRASLVVNVQWQFRKVDHVLKRVMNEVGQVHLGILELLDPGKVDCKYSREELSENLTAH